MRLGVVYIDGGESSLLQVTVPESGVTEGLALGSPVTLIGLGRTRTRSGHSGPSPAPSPGAMEPETTRSTSRPPHACTSGCASGSPTSRC